MTTFVEVIKSNTEWPSLFEMEALHLKKALNCLEIHHIGSTAIPNLAAKPILDMIPVVDSLLEVDFNASEMERLGYKVMGEHGIAFRRFFQKKGLKASYNIHVYENGNPEIERHLKFRNWMRENEDDRKAYEKLKISLAQKYPNDLLKYCLGKEDFVSEIDKKTGYSGWKIVKALTHKEWASLNAFRSSFFKADPDPFLWTFIHQDHIHFMFYKDLEIIGYAHLQLMSEKRAILRLLTMVEDFQNQGHGSFFLTQCEKWLSLQGYKTLHLLASPLALPFFSKGGYAPMSFVNPEAYESRTESKSLGKILSSH